MVHFRDDRRDVHRERARIHRRQRTDATSRRSEGARRRTDAARQRRRQLHDRCDDRGRRRLDRPMSAAERVPRRPLRLAEAVADALRNRILNAEYADGAMLPKQEELVDEFGVSLPSVREALRSLETEGLITV